MADWRREDCLEPRLLQFAVAAEGNVRVWARGSSNGAKKTEEKKKKQKKKKREGRRRWHGRLAKRGQRGTQVVTGPHTKTFVNTIQEFTPTTVQNKKNKIRCHPHSTRNCGLLKHFEVHTRKRRACRLVTKPRIFFRNRFRETGVAKPVSRKYCFRAWCGEAHSCPCS